MWDINEKYLQTNEKMVYSDRASMLSCIVAYIWLGFMSIGVLGATIGSFVSESNATEMHSLLWAYLVFALPSVYVILKRLSTRYAVTTKGLIRRTGIITTSIKTVPFKHITSIEVNEPIAGKIYRYGNLRIDTSGSGKAIEFEWKYIRSAHKVKKLIEQYVGGEA